MTMPQVHENLSVRTAPSGPNRTTIATGWEDIPHMSGSVVVAAGGDLEIAFSGEVGTTSGRRMFVRALIDGQPAEPSDVVFARGDFTGTHTFTFTKNDLTAGIHTVAMQWHTDAGGSAYIGDRTLTLHASAHATRHGSLVVKAAPSGPNEVTSSTRWVNVPDMTSSVTTPAGGNLEITFGGEVGATNGRRMFVRALIDGQPADPSDVVFARGDFTGTHTFTFTKQGVGAGTHAVAMQWHTDASGSAYIGDRTLTLHASVPLTRYGGLTVKSAPSGPNEVISSPRWSDIPDMSSGLATSADGTLEIAFSGEVGTTSGRRMFVRALIDGQPAEPSDVVFARGDFTGTHTFTFTKNDLTAGIHTVAMQWHTDAGGSAYIGDRTLTLNHWRGQVPNISEPFHSLKPTTGTRRVLTILWDPQRPDHPRPSRQAVERLLFGPEPSVRSYFLEVSGGRFTIENSGLLGWYAADKPADHYWNHPSTPCSEGFVHGHTEKWAEAIRRAARDIDFGRFDRNRDRVLGTDELTILIVIPQNQPFGTQRGVVGREHPTRQPLVVDGVRVDTMVEAYIGSPLSLGLVAHELAHILLGAGDMYFTFFQPYAAGPYSLMDQSPRNPPHLDPFHKLRLGWLTPTVATASGWYHVRDVETNGEVIVLYDPGRGDDEYFIVENRWRGGSHDSHIPHTGLAVWHIIENRQVYDNLPPPAGVDPPRWNDPKFKGWARRGIRMIRPIYGPPIDWSLWDGARPQTGYDLLSVDPNPNHATLRWADGSPSGFAIRSIPISSADMRVHIAIP